MAGLLALHALLAFFSVCTKSVTADEILHLTHGFFVDRHGDHRVQPENGLLPQRLHGLAAILAGARTPVLDDNVAWRTSSGIRVAHQFFYESGNDHWPMLLAARGFNLVFSLGTAGLVFWWARRIAGNAAGLIALTLYSLEPNLLAHAALATSDLAAVFFLLASVSAFWLALEHPTAGRIGGSALIFGLACTAKFSAVLLPPMFLVLLLTRRPSSMRALAGIILAHALGALALIWFVYGFRFTGFAPGLPPADHYNTPLGAVLPQLGWQGTVIDWAHRWRLLPEAFLYGYAWVLESAKARAAFLAGEYSIHGWVHFFPLAFLWKTTLAMLTALVLATAALARRWLVDHSRLRSDLLALAPLVILLAAYGTVSLTSNLNIGHRHILPLYPILIVLLGVWCVHLPAPRIRPVVVSLLLFGQAAACLSTAPHFLTFFNRAAGGPAQGYRLLVDSSLDWGQDLPGLAEWLRANNTGANAQPVFLSYFGSGSPDYYRIKARHLPFTNGFGLIHPWSKPTAGLYCISATMLQQVYSPVRGDYTPALEREYQILKKLEPLFHGYWKDTPSRTETLRQVDEQELLRAWQRYDWLRLARLTAYLRATEPAAIVGNSILIYRLDGPQIEQVLDRRYSDWAAAVASAARPR